MRAGAQRFRWTATVAGMLVALGAGTWWLLTKETRGAEIANVLALPVAVLGLVVMVSSAVPGRTAGRQERKLTGAKQSRDVTATEPAHAADRSLRPGRVEDQPQAKALKATSLTGRAMTKELFFLAGHPAPLHDAAAELRRAGFLIRRQPHDLGGMWSLVAYSATSELNESDLATLDEIAESCGIDFDGWGTYVGPPEPDDGPGK
jgi:hypothetical protein